MTTVNEILDKGIARYEAKYPERAIKKEKVEAKPEKVEAKPLDPPATEAESAD